MAVRKALATAYAGHLFRYGCILILIPFYARVLGPDEYGKVLVATALGSLVWIIQNWGFSVLGARTIATSSNQQERQAEMSRQMTARLLIMPAGLLIGLGGTLLSPVLREAPLYGLLGTAWGVLSGFNLGWYFQGLHQFKNAVKAEVVGLACTLVLAISLVTAFRQGIMALWALVIATSISNIYAYRMAAATASFRPASAADGARLLRESVPFFLNTAAGNMLATGGGYILGLYSSPAQVAVYGIAERIVTTVLGLLGPAGQVMLPWLAKLKTLQGTEDSYRRSQRLASLWVVSAGLVTGTGAFLLGPYVLPLVFGTEYTASAEILRFFAPLFLLYAYNHAMIIYRLLPARRERHVGAIMIVCALVCVAAMVVAAPAFGGNGVAAARVAAELLAAVALSAAVSKLRRES
ncbi:oligosaccharide flippase family protein [Aquabacterium fontiphilum]|jgi:PST family polysaccharide transporter|uniref:oligosaccharide flippase family protein n=1 Tax=Aquabacterium fontiphilum TaxID=450365 RepID=UPI001379117F|nr:oligosaccharide flippase family protein [Aquabacterium fontiphilum]NBD20646.1 oligosaccharide flippase family protein [Aquabacterium fontiphilum]